MISLSSDLPSDGFVVMSYFFEALGAGWGYPFVTRARNGSDFLGDRWGPPKAISRTAYNVWYKNSLLDQNTLTLHSPSKASEAS